MHIMRTYAPAFGLAVSIPLAAAYIGDMTHYTPGSGSCGAIFAEMKDAVALSLEMMANGANPNENPKKILGV